MHAFDRSLRIKEQRTYSTILLWPTDVYKKMSMLRPFATQHADFKQK